MITPYLTISNFILAIFLVIFFLTLRSLYKRDKDKNDIWEWKQLVSELDGKASQTKVMQLIGSITGTFIVIYQTVKDSLISEVFIAYLAALGLSAGFSRWLNHNDRNNCNDDYSDRYHDNHNSSRNDFRPDKEEDIIVTDDEITEFKNKNKSITD